MSCCAVCEVIENNEWRGPKPPAYVNTYILEDYDPMEIISHRRQEIDLCDDCFEKLDVQRKHDHCKLNVLRNKKRKMKEAQFSEVEHLICSKRTNYGTSQNEIKQLEYIDNRLEDDDKTIIDFEKGEYLGDVVGQWFPYIPNSIFFNEMIEMYHRKIEEIQEWKWRQCMEEPNFKKHFRLAFCNEKLRPLYGVSFKFK